MYTHSNTWTLQLAAPNTSWPLQTNSPPEIDKFYITCLKDDKKYEITLVMTCTLVSAHLHTCTHVHTHINMSHLMLHTYSHPHTHNDMTHFMLHTFYHFLSHCCICHCTFIVLYFLLLHCLCGQSLLSKPNQVSLQSPHHPILCPS